MHAKQNEPSPRRQRMHWCDAKQIKSYLHLHPKLCIKALANNEKIYAWRRIERCKKSKLTEEASTMIEDLIGSIIRVHRTRSQIDTTIHKAKAYYLNLHNDTLCTGVARPSAD